MASLGRLVLGWVALSRILVMMLPSGFAPQLRGFYTRHAISDPTETHEQVVQLCLDQLCTVPGIEQVRGASKGS